MFGKTNFDVIVIGGSYAGLSAALSLGRSLRHTLVIDSGSPCNAPTPHAHNFLTRDGHTPGEIASTAKSEVARYPTVQFYEGIATSGRDTDSGFTITTDAGDVFTAKKLIFATGLKDLFPNIEGYAACWGKSILHCPYCHGYEVIGQKTGIIGNGDAGMELAKMIRHWTDDLTIFTNGVSAFTEQQRARLTQHQIQVVETELAGFRHENGYIKKVLLHDQREIELQALYARPASVQHCDIPAQLGCDRTEPGLLRVDMFQQTTIPGIFAAGDNSNIARALSVSISSGTMAGAMANRTLIDEAF